MNNSFKKIFSIYASLSLSLNFLPTYNVLADDFVESYYSGSESSFGDSFNENEFNRFGMSNNNQFGISHSNCRFGASFDDRHNRLDMSNNNQFGISHSNCRFGASFDDRHNIFGMSNNNQFGTSHSNNYRLGMSLNNNLSNSSIMFFDEQDDELYKNY